MTHMTPYIKRIICIAALCLSTFCVMAQFTSPVPTPPKAWRGAVRTYVATGLFAAHGNPTYSLADGTTVDPHSRLDDCSPVLSLCAEVSMSDKKLTWGPFLYLDFYHDGWFTTFKNSDLHPTSEATSTYNYNYSTMEASAALGLQVHMFLSREWEFSFGAGVFAAAPFFTRRSCSIMQQGNALSEDLVKGNETTPLTAGIMGRASICYYLAENFYFGFQARYDIFELYRYDAVALPLQPELFTNNDHRPRLFALAFMGFKFE